MTRTTFHVALGAALVSSIAFAGLAIAGDDPPCSADSGIGATAECDIPRKKTDPSPVLPSEKKPADEQAPSQPQDHPLGSDCGRDLVICYDKNGDLFLDRDSHKRDYLPVNVRPGDIVKVIIFTDDAGDQRNLSVTFQGKKSQETPFEPPGAAKRTFAPATAKQLIAIPFSSDPVPEDATDFEISVFRMNGAAGWQELIPVDHGYSFYSVALLVAATYKGDRHVLRDLETTSDHAVDPGLALNIFPFGRERGRVGYIRTCRRGRIQRCLADMIGFQLATDLDLRDPTDKLYAGLVFEPVAGLGLSGGISLRKVAVVPPLGALPATEAMTGAAPADMHYVLRGYVAVTMTFDLLDTISSMGTKIRNVKPPE